MNSLKQLLTFIFLFVQVSQISAQDTISGVINHYAAVEEMDLCRARMIVDEVGSIRENDTLLLIQMQGASINSSNSDDFGRIQSLNGAGLFEAIVVDTVLGDTVQATYRWSNNYDVSGQVQLVRIPYYDNAVVEGALQAQAWNGRTGGILALFARRLTLLDNIDVSGLGFRGGSAELDYNGTCSWLINHDNYRYDDGSIRSGEKGEGIAGIPPQWPRGRGAAANGGGAGNDHNAGGGGGAQITAGGRGGRNNNPNPLGCQGRNPGEGARALPIVDDRLFLGGGGGAGHGNNDVATDGGNGGGIVLIFAEEMTGNGFSIRANGQDAADARGDGAGAGGAGGSILLEIGLYSDDFVVEAAGGRGGSADNNNNNQCFGPGGGGSGGRVLGNFPATITTTVNGGENGITINSSECPDGPNGATPGEDGTINPPIPLNFSMEPVFESLIAEFVFTVDGLTVRFENLGSAPRFEWSFGDGSSSSLTNPVHNYGQAGTYTVTLLAIDPVCGDTAVITREVRVELLPVADASFSPGTGCAPLEVEFNNNSVNSDSVTWIFDGGTPNRSNLDNPIVVYDQAGIYSVELRAYSLSASDTLIFNDTIRVLESPAANFLFDVDDLELTTQNLSVGDDYFWLFGDGNSSSEFEPDHSYDSPGNYEVILVVSNDCGSDTSRASLMIGSPPMADFDIDSLSGSCAPVAVALSLAGTGFYDSLRWELPGATPALSNEESVEAVYDQAGSYDLRLILFHPFGITELFEEDAVIVAETPVADFEYERNGTTVRFSNLSTQIDDAFWDFGDGDTSRQQNPVHTYTSNGFYDVTLVVSNGICSDSLIERIFLDNLLDEDSLKVFIPEAFSPNGDGVNDFFTIYGSRLQRIERLQIFDRWGNRLFLHENFPPGGENMGWNGTANGKPLLPGVFVFLADIRFLNGAVKQVQGSVTLMK